MLPPQTCNKLDSFRQGLSDSRCRILKAAPSWSPSLPPWAARKTRLLPPRGQRKYHPRSWGCLKKGIRQTFSLTEPCPCNYFDINPLGDENRVAASGKSVSSKPYSFLPESKDIGRMPCLGIGRIPTALRSAVMEESNRACYVHYNHADPCSAARWTAKESYEFMYGRPWQTVSDFYSELVRGGGYALLASLFPTEKHESQELTENFEGWEDKKSASVSTNKTGRWARVTFKIILSYHGKSFEGWQKQPGLDTVQSLVEKSLGKFVDEKKAQHLRSQSLPVDGCAVVAGRTDKGVTALQQVCSFYTWRKDVTKGDIEDAINNAAPGKLRALYISEVSRVFHPNFSAKWRRYLYIFPLSSGQEDQTSRSEGDSSITSDDSNDNYEDEQVRYDKEDDGMVTIWNTAEDENYYSARKARNFSISKMNQLLRQLEGKCLSYRMFARDTKASRSIGPPTECFMFHARATETGLPCANEAYNGQRVMCVELVANRFLRKMVRVLVATAIREAAAGADDDALIKLMDATCRRATAPPAPPDGLCLVDVGYGDFKQEYCLIL